MDRNWPVKEVAFVITHEVLAMMNFLRMKRSGELPEEYCMPEQEFMKKLFNGEINLYNDGLDFVDFLYKKLPDVQIHTEFTGEASTLENSLALSDVELEYLNDCIIYLPLSRGAEYFSAAYHAPEEMTEEIREKIQDLLPGWWDVAMTLCEITGTFFD